MNKPAISVIIPTLCRLPELKKCLDALAIQSFNNFEIIIVASDNNEHENLIKIYQNLNIRIVKQQSKGLTSARNTGLLFSNGSIVSFIDDDVVVDKNWLTEIHKSFAESSDIGGVSGPTLIPQKIINNRDIMAFQNKIKKNILLRLIGKLYIYFVLSNEPKGIGKIFKSGAFSLGANYAESAKLTCEIQVDYLEACNMSYRKEILDRIGGFSTEYKGLGDWSEPDLAFRVRYHGYKLIFNPNAAVEHHISQSGVYNQRGRNSYHGSKNFIYFYFKWIRPNTLNKFIRFSFNLTFINLYWLYKFLQSANPDWLLGIKGTLSGLACES